MANQCELPPLSLKKAPRALHSPYTKNSKKCQNLPLRKQGNNANKNTNQLAKARFLSFLWLKTGRNLAPASLEEAILLQN
jgi:hypothetical protein